LGMVRTAMEEEGTWDSSTVIVIADHGLRDFWNALPVWSTDEEQFRQSLDPLHVPFMVKMPHQDGASHFDVPISSTAVYELSVQAMNGRITSSEEALRWFEKNAGDHPPVCLSRSE
jgi:membrane-anchored protein YejM (alkaline phosphatase superfamily)